MTQEDPISQILAQKYWHHAEFDHLQQELVSYWQG
jgi:hypothetical protein